MVKRIAVYAGSFDPITYGHLDIIRKAAKLFDVLHVAIGTNSTKKPAMFGTGHRMNMIRDAIADLAVVNDLPEIRVATFGGLLVDYMAQEGIQFIVRGLRDHMDFGYESHIARINDDLSKDPISTVWLYADARHSHISSTLVREMISYNKDFSKFSPVRA